MRRGEIRYANLGGDWGRRPALIVMANELLPVLSVVICAPVTTRLRGLSTRVRVGSVEGLRESSEMVCEALIAIARDEIDTVAIGSLAESRFSELDRALARAMDIRRANLLPA